MLGRRGRPGQRGDRGHDLPCDPNLEAGLIAPLVHCGDENPAVALGHASARLEAFIAMYVLS